MFCCDRKMYKYIFSCYICVIVCVLFASGAYDLEEGAECYSEVEKLNGTCVSIRRCMEALLYIRFQVRPQVCSFNGLEPIVCCTDCELVNDTSQYTVGEFGNYLQKSGRKSSDKCLEYLLKSDPFSLIQAGKYRQLSEERDKKCYTYYEFWNRPDPRKRNKTAEPEKNPDKIEEKDKKYEEAKEKEKEEEKEVKKNKEKEVEIDKKNEDVQEKEKKEKREVEKDKEKEVETDKVKEEDLAFLKRGAILSRFPHMALLGYGESPKTAQWVCGGSVISHRFILTAGHCISTAKSEPVRYIAVGILARSELSEYQVLTVKQIIPHPQYKSPIKYHDIALLETNEWIKFSAQISPICLYDGTESRLNVAERRGIATGFGATGPKMGLAERLRYVKVQKYTDEECEAAYPPYRHLKKGFDPVTQICYGDRKGVQDSCEGDSGGPLFESTDYLHEQRLIGVVSTGRQCGTVGNPGIYTRVEHYLPWIESIVWPS